MLEALFGLALVSATAIVVLTSLKLVWRGFEFWPPPDPSSWQSHTFRMFFRVFFASLIATSILDFDTTQSASRYIVGTCLLLVGFGLALRWTNFLGWGNAFGNSDGLRMDGIYRFSRNPIYVVSIVGMLGWALLVGSWMATTLLAIWACLYIVAPLLEEPWMKRQYGDAFTAYMSQVPRYGSLPAIANHVLTQLELKIPPLVITLICAGVIYGGALTVPHSTVLSIETRGVLAASIGIAAVTVLFAALMAFRRHRTTMNPLDPRITTSLVTKGIYAYSRNPMYLAMFIALLGLGVFLGQMSSLLGLVLYVAAMTRLQILPVERILRRKFGGAYTEYLNSSHRWLGQT